MVVDRDFRDSIETMEDFGLNVALPSFLNSRRQFTSSEANESRYLTTIRCIVEAANTRIKQFEFFANTTVEPLYTGTSITRAPRLYGHSTERPIDFCWN